MALAGSNDITISWAGSPLTAVEECSGIQYELANGDALPFGSSLQRKRVIGVRIPDNVTLSIPFDDAAGSDFTILNTAFKARTEAAFKVTIGSTVSREISMTAIKCNPVLAGGEVTMVEVELAPTGSTLTEV